MNSLFDEGVPNPAGYREVTPEMVHARLGTTRLVDVREPDEFVGELGHIAGAELVPLATVEAASAGWNPAEEFVMVCRSGGRSGRAAALLASRGFSRVLNMVGGMLAYGASGFPVER